MRLLSKLGALLGASLALFGPSGVYQTPRTEVESTLNRRRTTGVVKSDREALAAAQQKRERRAQRLKDLGISNPKPVHWNSASKLPIVDTPLLLLIKEDGEDAVYKAERRNWVAPADKEGDLQFFCEDGSVLTGRFPWTYP